MLSFYCTDCKETIACPDSEGPDQVFDRLDKHTEECALATLTFQGTNRPCPEESQRFTRSLPSESW